MFLKMEPIHNTKPDLAAAGTTSDPGSKDKHQRLFERGLIWLGIGVFLMALSFGINFLLFQSDKSFLNAMYILTSLGAVCIMKGLADILGF